MEKNLGHRVCLCIIVMLSGGFFLYARNGIPDADNDKPCIQEDKLKVRDGIRHGIGINLRPSYIMPTHGFYNGYNPLGRPLRLGGSLHASYSFEYPRSSTAGRLYPGAYQGIGVGVQTFLAHDALGTPVSLYLFQGAPLARLADCLTLDYEWNFGLSAGWKPNEYLLTGSKMNVYINVGLFLKWRLNSRWDLQIGPEYTHYSNGDTTFPNGGANTVNFRIGARRHFGRTGDDCDRPVIFSSDTEERSFRDRMSYDITAFGAWRADRMLVGSRLYLINNAFPLAGIQFNPLYHFNHCLSAGASLDLIYDSSANLDAQVDEDDVLTYSRPAFLRQCAAGISARGQLKMPIFAVNIGIGYNFSFVGSDLRGIYGIFALKAYVTDSLFLNIGYRLSSVLYSHNLMFGIGWSIGED